MSRDSTIVGPHDHVFLGENHARNERRTWAVIALTATMMVAEITAGTIYGSMALLADGWHMSTHASALLITALAYRYARRNARNPRFTFGTGKFGDLAAFGSATVLAIVALLIGWESLARLRSPVPISFDEAILVAVLGLVVNLVSAWLLKDDPDHHHGHGHHHHNHDPAHAHDDDVHHGEHATRARLRDNNLRAAYLHVLADALTSVMAIIALLAGRSYGWVWLDPLMVLSSYFAGRGAFCAIAEQCSLTMATKTCRTRFALPSKTSAMKLSTFMSGNWGRDITVPSSRS